MFYTSQVVLAEFLKHQQYEQEILHELWGLNTLQSFESGKLWFYRKTTATCPGEQNIARTNIVIDNSKKHMSRILVDFEHLIQ